MKVTIHEYRPVASWNWYLGKQSEEEDVCGICRVAYEGCCPECKRPGDDCPLIFGECTHIFHMHCLLKWLGTEQSKNCCPMDRRQWVTAEQSSAQPGVAS